jgi:hypothetical protein
LKVGWVSGSAWHAAEIFCAGDFTFGPEILGDPWHVGTFKRNMTKNLSALFPAINDEVAEAFAGAFSP